MLRVSRRAGFREKLTWIYLSLICFGAIAVYNSQNFYEIKVVLSHGKLQRRDESAAGNFYPLEYQQNKEFGKNYRVKPAINGIISTKSQPLPNNANEFMTCIELEEIYRKVQNDDGTIFRYDD